MPIELPEAQRRLNRFADQQWGKALAYLLKRFPLSRTDCEDIFQEAFIILFTKIKEGLLDNLTSSLSTYFISICHNQALKMLRKRGHELPLFDELPDTEDEAEDERINRLIALDEDEKDIEARKEKIVRQMVKEMPNPCDKILKGYYFDGLSMRTLAAMYDYSSEKSVKVTKHRCNKKFKERYTEFSNLVFG